MPRGRPKKTRTVPNENAALAQTLGTRLGFLLAAAPLPDDEKQAWCSLLPDMTVGQLLRFADLLETRFLDAATADVDATWERTLNDFAAARAQRQANTAREVEAAIAELEQTLATRKARRKR